jgi:nucleoid DNA-binding protein
VKKRRKKMKKTIASLCIFAMIAALSFAIPAADACEVRGVGYWKNHHTEREAIFDPQSGETSPIDDYLQTTVLYNKVNTANLRLYLSLKGKKQPLEKVLRQYAAVLLNVASGLTTTQLLYQGEWELIQSLNQNHVFGISTLSDAMLEIENAIYSSLSNGTTTNLEEARELAEAINNGAYCL